MVFMSTAFGDVRTLPASDDAKDIMKQLVTKDLFKEQRDVWMLGASLGILYKKEMETDRKSTFQNINSLDPEGIFAAVMVGLLPNDEPRERVKKLVNFAEWGIRFIFEKEQNGNLNFKTLGLVDL